MSLPCGGGGGLGGNGGGGGKGVAVVEDLLVLGVTLLLQVIRVEAEAGFLLSKISSVLILGPRMFIIFNHNLTTVAQMIYF